MEVLNSQFLKLFAILSLTQEFDCLESSINQIFNDIVSEIYIIEKEIVSLLNVLFAYFE